MGGARSNPYRMGECQANMRKKYNNLAWRISPVPRCRSAENGRWTSAIEKRAKSMDRSQLQGALESAKTTLKGLGKTCIVSADDIEAWFKADTPYPDITLDQVLLNRWLVIHEVVEIEAIKRMGLKIAKDTILKNPGLVDEAHFEAAAVELDAAIASRDSSHLKDRIKDISRWIENPGVLPEMKRKYSKLREGTERALMKIQNEE